VKGKTPPVHKADEQNGHQYDDGNKQSDEESDLLLMR
jgi:hypothetical protein